MTLYLITEDLFSQLEKSDNVGQFDLVTLAKYYCTFESFMGLKFLLLKGLNEDSTILIKELFNPEQSLGVKDFKTLDPMGQFDAYDSGNYIPYLNPSMITKIGELVKEFSENDILSKYNSKELNDNDIYPSVWHDDNSDDRVYNLRNLLEDFRELKKIFDDAIINKDYILVLG